MTRHCQILTGALGFCIIAALAYLNLAAPIANSNSVPATPTGTAADQLEGSSAGDLVSLNTASPLTDATRLTKEISRRLSANGPGDQEWAFTHLLPELVKLDPQSAARFAEANEIDGTHPETMRVVAETWAELNLEKAASWAVRLPDPNEADTVLGCVCFQAARSSPQNAIRTLEAQGLNERRETMLANLAQLWADENSRDALAWAESHPPGELRDHLLLSVAISESANNPADAARIVAERLGSGPNQDNAVMDILGRWAEQNAEAATAWVRQIPSSELKARASEELLRLEGIPPISPFDKLLPMRR